MTPLEVSVDDALCLLKTMRGALLVVETSNEEDAGDYFGLCGQKEAILDIVKKQYEALDEVIKSLSKFMPEDANSSN